MGKGKHHDDTAVTVTQDNINQSLAASAAVGHIPPDSEEMKAGHALLGRAARVSVARMLTVILSNFDIVTGTYWGKVMNANRAEAPVPFADGEYISGLKRYPWAENPKADFQFVLAGEDESVLVNLARDNAAARLQGSGETPTGGGDSGGQGNN